MHIIFMQAFLIFSLQIQLRIFDVNYQATHIENFGEAVF